jgi:hypothetical protein
MIYAIESFGEVNKENHSRFLVEVADCYYFKDIQYYLSLRSVFLGISPPLH